MRPAYLSVPVAVLWLAVLGNAAAAEFDTVLLEQSRLEFSYRQMGATVPGRFQRYRAELAFDPANPQQAKASVEVDLAGIDAGSDEANDELAGAPWFDVKRYPKARFVSKSWRALDDGRYEIAGRLSVKGREREVIALTGFQTQGALGVFEGGFTLRRGDFDIGAGAWADFSVIANEVPVRFHLVVTSAGRK